MRCHLSEWRRYEWECARDNGKSCRGGVAVMMRDSCGHPDLAVFISGIPIIVCINIEKFHVRPLVKQYIDAGFAYLLTAQVISYSAAHRKVSL